MELLKKIGKSLLIGTIAGVVIAMLTNYFVPRLIDRLENQSYYMRYFWKNMELVKTTPEERESNVCIIDIDDYSQQKMGVYWNWNRGYHAQLINNLKKQFPGAIIFDIFFSNPEDTNHIRRIRQLLDRSTALYPEAAFSLSQENALLSTIDYDRQFIDATRNAGVVFQSLRLSDPRDYLKHQLSQVENRKTLAWHDSLHPSSALTFAPEITRTFPSKEYLDGIFPPLARAARDIGHINIFHNDDAVIREMPLFYRFGDNQPVYMPVSMRAICTLFGTPNNEIAFVPGKYIDIGKPFKIFNDSTGRMTFSYPDMTVAQVKAIVYRGEEILALPENKTLTISSFLKIGKSAAGESYLSMSCCDFPAQLVKALRAANLMHIRNVKTGDTLHLASDIAITAEDELQWKLTAPFGDEEWYFGHAELDMLDRLDFAEFDSLAPGAEKLVFHALTIKRKGGQLISTIPVLCGKTLEELCRTPWNAIESMRPGMRMDFGETVRVPLTHDNKHIVTYFGPKKAPFKYYSYYELFKNKVRGGLDGKIFIIGSTAPSMFDIVSVPLDQEYPGVEVHASLMNSMLTNTFIIKLDKWRETIILLLIGILIGFIAFMLKPLPGALLTVAGVAVYFLIAMQLFGAQNLWIPIARPVITIILTYTVVMVYRYITEEKDRKFLQNTFKAYLSPELIDIMYKERQMPTLGGEEGVRTAYFTDIQGFSTFSEKLGSPTRLVELLNEYLSAMTDILLARYGTLDKYEGDAIIAFFGAPMPMPDHALQACATALDMQTRLGELRAKWAGEGDKWPQIVHEMRMRIGVNTGAITTGNMGSKVRMNYTMMGDAVNLAARLESAAKQYGVYTMISDATYEIVKDQFEARLVDNLAVVGKSEPVKVYELMCIKGGLDPAQQKMVAIYNQGVERYFKRDWAGAIELLTQSHQLEPFRLIAPKGMTPSKKILEYCTDFNANPPPPEWDGVSRLTSK
jgi:class 3 adenylate cyclase/CHASE2 domain-containing sensor protein